MRTKPFIGWLWVIAQFIGLAVFVVMPWRSTSPLWLILGAVVIALGIIVVTLAFVRLGDALTPTPVPKVSRSLRTTGIYAYVRHPIYSGIIVCLLGWIIAVGSWWTVLVGVLMVAFFTAKSRWEDHLLAAAYGAQWQEWAGHVGAFIPHRSR